MVNEEVYFPFNSQSALSYLCVPYDFQNKTLVISYYNVNLLVLLIDSGCVFCVLGTEFLYVTIYISGPGSVVSIATTYGLDGPGIESRWGARFSAPVQTGPEAHPASCTLGTGSL